MTIKPWWTKKVGKGTWIFGVVLTVAVSYAILRLVEAQTTQILGDYLLVISIGLLVIALVKIKETIFG